MKFFSISLALASMLVANEKSGFFVGIEAGFTPSATNYATLVESAFTMPSKQKTRAFPLGLALGYQHYFTESQGISLQARAAYATYKTSKTQALQPTSDQGDDAKGISFRINTNVEALYIGLDASYLYDFLTTDNHALGFDAAVGLDLAHFLSTKMDVTTAQVTLGNSLGAHSSVALALGFGMHYHYKTHHQFGIKYRYTGHSMDKQITKDSKLPNSEGSYRFVAATANLSSIVFYYAYKF